MILVVGTGRSGTSLVAGILYYLGVDMGDPFIMPDEDNEFGYFESVETVHFNEYFIQNFITYEDYCKNLLYIFNKKKEPWGLKDPRISELLPYYFNFLENPKIIRCRRNHQDTIASLQKAYSFTEERAKKLIETRDLKMNESLEGRDVLEINFEEKHEAVDKICKYIGFNKTQDAVDFVR